MADGVFYAELNELLTRELAEHGYSGVEVRVTPIRTEIIIRATRTQNVLGEPLASLTQPVVHQIACSASCRPKLHRLGVHITGPCCPCGCSLCSGMGYFVAGHMPSCHLSQPCAATWRLHGGGGGLPAAN